MILEAFIDDTPQNRELFKQLVFGIGAYASKGMMSDNPHAGIYEAQTSRTLDLNGGNPACNQGGIAIVEVRAEATQADSAPVLCMATQQGGAEILVDRCPTITAAAGMSGNNQPVICLQGNGIDRSDNAGCNGKGWAEDVCYTLNTMDRPAVVYGDSPDVSAYRMRGFSDYAPVSENESLSTLKARDYKDNGDLVCGVDCRNLTEIPESYPTLQAKPNGGQSLNFSGAVRVRYIVRRLTPTECARLQGFPDDWGVIDAKEDFTDAEYNFWLIVRNTHAAINGKPIKVFTKAQMLAWYEKLHTDSSEYKLWGNGLAYPTALYVMEGVRDALDEMEDF